MNTKKTGTYIKQKRTEAGLTQKELAEKINCTDKAISRWETGRGFPDASMLEPLSKALGVTVSELLQGTDIPKDERTYEFDIKEYKAVLSRRKRLNNLKIVIAVILILFSVYKVKQIIVLNLVQNLLRNSEAASPYSYFESPEEAIYEALDLSDNSATIETDLLSYKYGESIFKTEDKNTYIEFFIAEDNYTVWWFKLDKVNFGNTLKYKVNYFENNVQFDYEWKEINERYAYRFEENEEAIDDYKDAALTVCEFTQTAKAGEFTNYLLFADSGE